MTLLIIKSMKAQQKEKYKVREKDIFLSVC